MLGAGMGAAGKVDVDRVVKLDARIEILRQSHRMLLGIGGGESTAGVSGAGDDAAADVAGRPCEAELFKLALHERDFLVRYVGDQQVLPDGEADGAAAKLVGKASQAAHLCAAHSRNRQDHADVGQTFLLLRMDADMAVRVCLRPLVALGERETAEWKVQEF